MFVRSGVLQVAVYYASIDHFTASVEINSADWLCFGSDWGKLSSQRRARACDENPELPPE
jgi:hypothetical protein